MENDMFFSSPSQSADSEMTCLSRAMFDNALHINSTEDALNLLVSYRNFRTLKDILNTFGAGTDLRKTLVDGLMRWQPSAVRDSVNKKVRNWLNGTTVSISKQDAFILSRILNLSLDKTNDFLKQASGEGIHWRNPEDIAWCYAIIHGMDHEQTLNLLDRVNAIKDVQATPSPDAYTQMVYEIMQDTISLDEDAFISALKRQWSKLGTMHNTSYQLFNQYMDLLKKGYQESDRSYLYDENDKDEKYRLRTLKNEDKDKRAKNQAERIETARREAKAKGEVFLPDQPGYRMTLEYAGGTPELILPEENSDQSILEEYLYRKLVPAGNHQVKDPVRKALQQMIRQNWPDAAGLSRMRKRQINIPRKVLILLFLATNGSDSDYEDFDDEEYSQEETFLDIYTRLNLMLTSCGFLKLDPRSAFDWMILFCISSGDLWESDDRIQALLSEVFSASN